MRVCGGCGIVRMDAKACPHCAVAGNWVDAPDRVDGAFWVCALVKFKCRVCGFVVPLNHLDMDGGITCARCGVEQAFAVETWQSAIELAHATGDLAGARGEAAWSLPNVHQSKRAKREHEQSVLADAEYTFGRIGKSRWFAEIGPLGPSELHVTVSPGVALCAKCHTPFETREIDGEKTEVRCATCDATSTYRVPDAARKMSSALRSVVAPEHRCDRQAVKVIEASGQAALALVCPSCSASLPMSAVKDKLVTCTFCNMVARVPDRTWFRVSGKDPVPEAIWLLFNGPSARRASLERARKIEEEAIVARQIHAEHEAARRRSAVEAEARRDAEGAAAKAAQANAREREAAARDAEALERERAPAAEAEGAGREAPRRAQPFAVRAWMLAVVLLLAGAVWFGLRLLRR